MDENNHYNIDPWEQDSYKTGSTNPPKKRGSLVAGLCVAVILLLGIISALGVMNIRLFHKLQGKGQYSMSFLEGSAPIGNSQIGNTQNPSAPYDNDVTIDLNPAPDGVENIPQQGGLSYQQIYEKNIPSVVSVLCQMASGSSTGTGVILSEEGYVVTNHHVVEGAQSIRVLLTDERIFQAYLVGTDAVSDLAVLYIEADDLMAAEFGDASQLQVGDAVAAIGDPLGVEFRGTMTDGIVSAINRNVTTNGRNMTLIQTNAALNAGNSGGPLINCYGQVVGINTMKISMFVDDAGVEGLGFAIPSTTVKEIVDQLIAQGYVSGRPVLKLSGSSVSVMDQRFYRLPAGFWVSEVAADSNEERAGIQQGDIITRFNGAQIQSKDDLQTALYNCKAGDAVEIILYRYSTGQQYTVTVVLEEAEG